MSDVYARELGTYLEKNTRAIQAFGMLLRELQNKLFPKKGNLPEMQKERKTRAEELQRQGKGIRV